MKKLLLPIIILLSISVSAQTVEKIGCAKAVYTTEDSNILRGDVCIVYFCEGDATFNAIYETPTGYMFNINNLYGGQLVTMKYCIDEFPADKMLKLNAFENKNNGSYECEPFKLTFKN